MDEVLGLVDLHTNLYNGITLWGGSGAIVFTVLNEVPATPSHEVGIGTGLHNTNSHTRGNSTTT